MPGTTGNPWQLPYPTYTDPANGAGQIQALAQKIDDSFEQINANIAQIATRFGASIGSALAQSVATSTDTPMTFVDEHFDNDGMANLGVSNTLLTVQHSGYYYVTARINYPANATGVRAAFIQVNGVTVTGLRVVNAGAASSTQVSPDVVLRLDVGNTLRLVASQNSGVSLNVTDRYLQAVRIAAG